MVDTVDTATLEKLAHLNELEPVALEQLARKTQKLPMKAGTKVQAGDQARWMLYLLEGKLSLFADGQPLVIEAFSRRAQQPIFGASRLKEYAVALSQCQVLRVDRNQFDTLSRQQSEAGYEIEETTLSDVESALFSSLYQRIVTGQLALPALPEVATKIQSAINDPKMDATRLARIVQMDFAVTGGLIKAANSALYGGAAPVHNVRDAVTRLGFAATRQLVISIAMKQVFKTSVRSLQRRMLALWDRSVRVSALSYVLARQGTLFDPEHALLAGLLHQVGMVPLLDYLGQHHPDMSDAEIDHILNRLHPVVGELVINDWGLGPDLSTVVREVNQYERNGSSPPDYCDVVLVAHLYALTHPRKGQPVADVPRYDQVPAYAKLGLEPPNEEMKLDLFEEAEQEIRQVMEMLKAPTGA
ncbi:MAG: HDOD domain-containing protein [Pseudomonadota bacterium]